MRVNSEPSLQVLLLLPMRNVAYKVVSRLLVLAQKETRKDSIQGKARFLEDFGPQEEEEDEKTKNRSQEHRVLFHGNTDDHFRLGIKLTRSAAATSQDSLTEQHLIEQENQLRVTYNRIIQQNKQHRCMFGIDWQMSVKFRIYLFPRS